MLIDVHLRFEFEFAFVATTQATGQNWADLGPVAF
jgi:hypothetical protein